MVRQGWRTPAPWTPLNSLAWLTATADPAELPVVPHLASGELPSLTLVLQAIPLPSNSRFVLRMWPVDLELINGSHAPVWVGSVVEERIDRPFSLITIARTQSDVNKPTGRNSRRRSHPGAWRIRTVAAAADGWDGRVLLIPERSLRRAMSEDRSRGAWPTLRLEPSANYIGRSV